MADKALLLGVNKYKKVGSLRGCVNDVKDMQRLLTNQFAFNTKNIRTLIDEEVVKSKVVPAMKWLLKDAKANDRLVLHFSGHGSQIADVDGDENEGFDELICLHDMDFNDPSTYLLDDELRKWSQGLPAGAQLTIVFDSCHSGSGTRMLLTPTGSRSAKSTSIMVDLKTSTARALTGTMRGMDSHEVVDAMMSPESPETVRLRFVEPPLAVRNAINARKQSGKRGAVVAKINHVLLAGCRDDQTSADAHIDNDFHGAFTYHLCKAIRDGGVNLERKELITRVEKAMFAARFSQSPQLEGPTLNGPLFGKSVKITTSPGTKDNSDEAEQFSLPTSPTNAIVTDASADALVKIFHSIALLQPEAQVEAVKLLQGSTVIAGQTAATTLLGAAAGRQTGGRQLVYVHGICKHTPGYSNDWWNSLKPFTSQFGAGELGAARHEVLWSDLVNARDLGSASELSVRDVEEMSDAKHALLEALQDRVDRQVVESDSPRELDNELPALDDTRDLSNSFLSCLDDFTVYMVNSSTRAQILKRFTDVVRPILSGGAEIDIIAHSWGTVVAYEGLRELAEEGSSSGHVRNFITVGAALSIGPVKAALRSSNKDGKRPSNVSRWVNVNARGDIVGGVLKGRPYQVDEDFPNVDPFECTKLFGRAINPACAHRSYFVRNNTAVNQDIFAAFINRA